MGVNLFGLVGGAPQVIDLHGPGYHRWVGPVLTQPMAKLFGKLSGIACLVGKNKDLNFYLRVHWLSECTRMMLLKMIGFFQVDFTNNINVCSKTLACQKT